MVWELYNKVQMLRSDINCERKTNEVLFDALHSSTNGKDAVMELHAEIKVLRQSLDREKMTNKELRKTVKELTLSNKENLMILSQFSSTALKEEAEIAVGDGEAVIGKEDVSSNDDVVGAKEDCGENLTKKNKDSHLFKEIDMSKLVVMEVEVGTVSG